MLLEERVHSAGIRVINETNPWCCDIFSFHLNSSLGSCTVLLWNALLATLFFKRLRYHLNELNVGRKGILRIDTWERLSSGCSQAWWSHLALLSVLLWKQSLDFFALLVTILEPSLILLELLTAPRAHLAFHLSGEALFVFQDQFRSHFVSNLPRCARLGVLNVLCYFL